jgi:hypothetical protein
MPSIHSSVSTSRPVRSQIDPGTRKPGSFARVLAEFRQRRRLEPQVHLDLGRRASVSTPPTAQPPALGRMKRSCSLGGEAHSFRDR